MPVGSLRRVDNEVLFWRNTTLIPFHECWEWTGGSTTRGPSGGKYGAIGLGRKHAKPIMAHRFSWELHFGPIPDGMLVLHRCDNPSCVNPAHLFLGTHSDNTADMLAKGRNVTRSKLTLEQVREIRRRVSAGETRAAIAREFGLHKSTVVKAASGRNWHRLDAHTPQR